MKRGFLRGRWENDRSRRPRSRIEERIRHRKLHQLHQRFESSEAVDSTGIDSDETVNLNSIDNASPGIESSKRSTSSSDTSSPRVFTSKQCVNLLEMVSVDKTSGKARKHEEILSTMSKNTRRNPSPLVIRRSRDRPRSAPCSPLFIIKCAKQKCVRDIFVDYKLMERDRIDEDRKGSKLSLFRHDLQQDKAFLRLSKSQEFHKITRQGSDVDVTENFLEDLRPFGTSISSGSACTNDLSGCEQRTRFPKTSASAVDVLTSKKALKIRNFEYEALVEKKSTSYLVTDSCSVRIDSSKLNTDVPKENEIRVSVDQRNSVLKTSSCISEGDPDSDSRNIEQRCELSNYAIEKFDDSASVSLDAATTADPEEASCSTAIVLMILPAGKESAEVVEVTHNADNLQLLDDSKKHQHLLVDRSQQTIKLNENENNCTVTNENITIDDLHKNCELPLQSRCETCCSCKNVAADKDFHPAVSNISGAHCVVQCKCTNFVESCSGDASNAMVNDHWHRRCHNHTCALNDDKNLCCRGQRSNLRQKRVTFCLPRSNFVQLADNRVASKMKSSSNCVHQVRTNEKFKNDITKKDKSPKIEVKEEHAFPWNALHSVDDQNKNNSHLQCCDSIGTNRRTFCNEIVNKRRDILNGACLKRNNENTSMEDCPSPVMRNVNFKDCDDSERDWTLSPKEKNVLASAHQIAFPKETQRAMSVLLHERKDLRWKKCSDLETQEQVNKDRMPTSVIINDPECRTTHVPSYAKALAVFQRACSDPLGGDSRTKKRVFSRGSDGDIHSRYTNTGECTLQKFGEQLRSVCERHNLFLRSTSNSDLYSGVGIMQSNGSDSSENGVDKSGWAVGLINGKYKYLTAETFGFKINANGASLKKKQLWVLEGSEHQVFLHSHLDRYLAVDQFGNVTCEAEDPSDPGCAFQIQIASDGSGRWALKNVQRGYFLGSSQDELKCTAKAPGEAEYWLVHLAARPQVNLRSAGRKRFAHLSATQDEIHVDAPVPWGEDTLFTLEFRHATTVDNDPDARGDQAKTEGGHYALHTCNNKYLAHDGKLLDTCTRDCLYAAEFHAGLLALRDIHGAYLAPIGSKAVLKSRSTTVTRDELFSLEESLPQAAFVAALNQRYVSVKQGVDVTANQDEISGHETFQLEFDRVTKRWYIRTMQDRYWSLEAGGGIQASDHKRSSNALFDLVWQPEDGTVALRANNGKFLATKRSGHLYANADSLSGGDSDVSKYFFYLMNRPVLVLRSEQGFVGPKSAASPKLECNKAAYETIRVERCERGIVRFKGQNGKYWHADSEGVTVDSDVPSDGFYLELREPSRICIKSVDGRYLTAGKNGALRLGETDYDTATKWEF